MTDWTLAALFDFFLREVPRLPKTYSWPIPVIEAFPKPGQRAYEANVELKRYLNSLWEEADRSRRHRLARTIVNTWGGIRSNSDETLRGYVDQLALAEPATPLKGVASYSKIYSIARPSEFAIYDARVAACLNAVQFNAGVHRGLAFNYVPGRNNTVGNVVTGRGFTQLERFSVGSLCSSGWSQMARNDTYDWYLGLLADCLKEASGKWKLYELEMALFANAESECERAMKLVQAANEGMEPTAQKTRRG